MRKYIFILGLAGTLLGCCKALPPTIYLMIRDEAGNNLLEGVTPTDSTWKMYLYSEVDAEMLDIEETSEGPAIAFDSHQVDGANKIYIQISPEDIDTLKMDFVYKGRNCNQKVLVEELYYNGVEFSTGRKGTVLSVIKY